MAYRRRRSYGRKRRPMNKRRGAGSLRKRIGFRM